MRSLLAAAVLLAALPASARTLVVHPGESIRAAVARASPGDRIQVKPGTYREGAPGDLNALTITRSGIELVGQSKPGHPVILENAGGQSYGIWVSPANSAGEGPQADDEHPPCGIAGPTRQTLHGFSLSGFTVRGFLVHGVHLACVDGFSIEGNVSEGNLVYGLFPVVSQNGLVTGNVVTGTTKDAGIYVGQSDKVLIAGNVSHGNLLGIEIENSRDCAAVANESFGNTFGIFVDILPHLERTTQERAFVAFNSVRDNNRPNDASPDDILGLLPAGMGILVAGGEATTVLANDVRNNGFAGIAITSVCLGVDCTDPTLDIDPFPVNDRIVGNRLTGNGTVPQDNPLFEALRADLVWDGTGTGNCWSANRFSTSTPPELPGCR
jgi:parallel beta-helix repeat protein